MSSLECPTCGHLNSSDALSCTRCGSSLSQPVGAMTGFEVLDEVEDWQPDQDPITAVDPVSFASAQTSFESAEPKPRPAMIQPVPAPTNRILDGTLSLSASLIDEDGQAFELPLVPVVYVGKPNEEIPVHVDLSSVSDAEIISRVHAVIHRIERLTPEDRLEIAYYVEDAGSMNGTSLNDDLLQPGTRYRKRLQSGDKITFGRKRQIHFRFQVGEEAVDSLEMPNV